MNLNENFKDGLLEFIRRTSTELSGDVVLALKQAHDSESPGSAAENALKTILDNVDLSQRGSSPICQDTGTLIFYVDYPEGVSTIKLRKLIEDAVVQATEKSYLRPNAVDPLLGKNSGNNLGQL